MANIRIVGVSKRFGNVVAVRDIHLSVDDRSFVTLLGPSGCGKSTLLNMIAGLEDPSNGEIYIDDLLINKVPPSFRNVAMVFQSYALYPHMSLRDNLSFALKIRGVAKQDIESKVERVSWMLGIHELLDRKPKELSGGQRQRVALGRAIVRDPKVFLLDEPLSNLDAALRLQMRAELKLLFDTLKATVIYVTHDQAEAMTMSDKIAVLKDGELQQVGTPLEIYFKPVNRFVAGFVGSPTMNLSPCRVAVDGPRFHLRTTDFELTLPASPTSRSWAPFAGRELIMGIRPEHLALAPDAGEGDVRGTCMVVERLGSDTQLLVKTGANVYTLDLPGSATVRTGQNLRIRFDLDALYLFDAESERALSTPEHLASAGGICP